MIITISGTAGSGKSSVGKLLAERLGYKFYTVGGLRRRMAAERGMTIEELNKLGETDPKTDTDADYYCRDLALKEGNIVMDGRVMFHFLPNSLKIFMAVDESVAVQRILGDKELSNRNEKAAQSAQEKLNFIQERNKSDIIRYKKHYGIDCANLTNYDLVIDSTHMTIEECVNRIIDYIEDKNLL